MRLLNIKTGFLEIKNIDLNNIDVKYIAVSHRWLPDELNLSKIGLIGLSDNVFIGDKLYNHLYSKINKNIKGIMINKKDIENLNLYHDPYQKWNDYLNFLTKNKNINKKDIGNHYKLINIINCIRKYEYNYIWIDTLCIDKSSSSELNENITSMFRIYNKANFVYVFFNDFLNFNNNKLQINKLIKDEWFTRGWTLQEYLANDKMNFYDAKYNFICNKQDIWFYTYNININTSDIKIPAYLFEKYENMIKSKIMPCGTILNWALERKTTRGEDKAYSLMGLLNTYITPLYGEGGNIAIIRLIKAYTLDNYDESIFDWIQSADIYDISQSGLPQVFNSTNYIHQSIPLINSYNYYNFKKGFTWTNKGVNIDVKINKGSLLFPIKIQEIITNEQENIIIKWFKKKHIFDKYYNINIHLYGINDNNICGIAIMDNHFNFKDINNEYLCIVIYNIDNKIICINKDRNFLWKNIDKLKKGNLFEFNEKLIGNKFQRIGKFIDNFDINNISQIESLEKYDIEFKNIYID